jgi:anti-sigma factor RsiW
MSCQLWRDWLDPYIDGACTPEENAGIEDHLAACPACATEALARMRMKQAIRTAAAESYKPSPEFRLRVEQTIAGPRKPPFAIPYLTMPRLTLPPLTKSWKQGLAVAAAVLVLAFVTWSVIATRHAAREQALAQLLDLHVATMASLNPVDVVSTDRHTVKPWFLGRLPFTFNLPEVDGTPYKLLGGKLMYYRNSPGAQLLFDLRKHQLSVFILQEQPGTTPKSLGVAFDRQKGFSIETWSQGGLRYVVIGDSSAADVRALGDLLRAAGQQ